jgi:hypothetical protein
MRSHVDDEIRSSAMGTNQGQWVRRCRMLLRLAAAILTVAGVVGFALYIQDTFDDPDRPLALLRGPVRAMLEASGRRVTVADPRVEQLSLDQYTTHLHTWVSWYYSPLNLRHWAVALRLLSPALACHLLARVLRPE